MKHVYSVQCMFVLLLYIVDVRCARNCSIPRSRLQGTCVLLEECPPLHELSKSEATDDENTYLRQSICSYVRFKIKVCCPPTSVWHKLEFKPIIYPTASPTMRPSTEDVSFGSVMERTTETILKNTAVTLMPTEATPRTVKPTAVVAPLSALPIISKSDFGDDDEPEKCTLPDGIPKYNSNMCGLQVGDNRILGGSAVASPDNHPWTVLLEYNIVGSYQVHCGGSLVTAQYVLTAAHCIITRSKIRPENVRLAEYNTSSPMVDTFEVDGGGTDSVTQVVIKIAEHIVHPKYNANDINHVHDIALIRMAEKALCSDFIRVVCLPFEDPVDYIESHLNETDLKVAGWGSNTVSLNIIKQEISLPYVAQDKCQAKFDTQIFDTQICAGGEKGKDTCSGDSGGGLTQFYDDAAVVIGVVSYGRIDCGAEGVPGVYTKVYKYIDWITKNIK